MTGSVRKTSVRGSDSQPPTASTPGEKDDDLSLHLDEDLVIAELGVLAERHRHEHDLRGLGAEVTAVQAGLADRDAADLIIDAATERFDRLDGLVNNAIWINSPTPFIDQPDDIFTRISDTGPRATFALMKAAHPHLVAGGGGSIVNLGSGAGAGGEESFAAYGAAKESIRDMSKVAALEWGADNIRVNVAALAAHATHVHLHQSLTSDLAGLDGTARP